MPSVIIAATFALVVLLTWLSVVDVRSGVIPNSANLLLALAGLAVTYLTAPTEMANHLTPPGVSSVPFGR